MEQCLKINYMNNQWTPPLNSCCNCQKSFGKGQEYWNLQKEGKTTMNICEPCQNKHSLEKKKYESSKCNHCKKQFQLGEENWELTNKETQQVWNTCLPCQNKHTFTKKTWE